ncbi:RDD family protein [Sagittula sp. SSi028]|uniref:RDD family protein n=1 Tax=Sagittula sp. SSi028 TaxID=3400636 RepID=UPI003AF5EFD1
MYSAPVNHLPDPERQAAFYDGVTVKRGIAWLIDVVLIAIATAIVSAVTILGLFFIPMIYLMIGFLYRWVTIAGGSATWGMRVMAIELRNAHGERLGAGLAFMHVLAYSVAMSLMLVQIGSVILMFVDERGRGLGDMLLGTVMLNRRG